LGQLLLAPPLGEKRILIDPGFRSGCKIVCLDEKEICCTTRPFIHAPQRAMAMKKIRSMVNSYRIDAISIGGTASRETEFFIKKIAFDKAVQYL
jgi:uncharacterized protein